MNLGPMTMPATMASRPAMRTGIMLGRFRDLVGDAFEPHGARRLHEDGVARLDGRACQPERIVGVAAQATGS